MGQRGLLVIGVFALLATGGFFLNYAFERGWIPPLLRVVMAVGAGIAIALWGDRLAQRGILRYGAALIGGGGGLVYLGLWAAAGPYELIGRQVGIVLLALVATGVGYGAVRHEVEALAVWALAGAYLAPAFLPTETASLEHLLAYLAAVGLSSLTLGRRMEWRVTFGAALAGFFLLPLIYATNELNTTSTIAYVAVGGVAGLWATKGVAWPEARLAALGLPWLLLFYAIALGAAAAVQWAALGGALALAAVVWWQHLGRNPLAPGPARPVEATVYVLAPMAPVFLAAVARPDALASWGGLVALLLAALYLAGGWPRRAGHLVGMGVVLLALAVSGQWEGTVVAVGWAALSVAALAADRWGNQRAARDVATGIAFAAFLQLFSGALAERATTDPALIGRWSLGWVAVMVSLIAGARLWRARSGGGAWEEGRSILWLGAAATLLLGGSLELQRLMRQQVRGFENAALASDVATCLFWLIYATAAAQLAPRWSLVPVRTVMLAAVPSLVALSFVTLFAIAAPDRPEADRAFLGVWSIGWYGQAVLPVLIARWWRGSPGLPDWLRGTPTVLWTAGGAALLLGGSIELHRVFGGGLAGNLAISTFWLAYAAALVRIGFWLDQKAIRSAGLAVAAVAAVKILLYDLSELQALYRVGSFFVLALVALGVAYVYNKKASRRDV